MAIRFFDTPASVLAQGISGVCQSRGISEDDAIQLANYYLNENSDEYYSDDPQLE